MQVSFKLEFWYDRDIIDNRDYMDKRIVMLENPQSLSPTSESLLFIPSSSYPSYLLISSASHLQSIKLDNYLYATNELLGSLR